MSLAAAAHAFLFFLSLLPPLPAYYSPREALKVISRGGDGGGGRRKEGKGRPSPEKSMDEARVRVRRDVRVLLLSG